jgi:hypothetical protein
VRLTREDLFLAALVSTIGVLCWLLATRITW